MYLTKEQLKLCIDTIRDRIHTLRTMRETFGKATGNDSWEREIAFCESAIKNLNEICNKFAYDEPIIIKENQ